jgi:cytochrome c oxidase assembly protein subunit 17
MHHSASVNFEFSTHHRSQEAARTAVDTHACNCTTIMADRAYVTSPSDTQDNMSSQNQATAKMPAAPSVAAHAPVRDDLAAPKRKRICCACPETKQLRDECIVMNGEDACQALVEAHKTCLRAEGFNV